MALQGVSPKGEEESLAPPSTTERRRWTSRQGGAG
jgi:hypothetical protein